MSKPLGSMVADRWAETVTSPFAAGAAGAAVGATSSKQSEKIIKDYLASRGGLKARFKRQLSKTYNRKARRDPKFVAMMAGIGALTWGGTVGAGRMAHARALRSRIDRKKGFLTPSERAIEKRMRRGL